MSPLLEICPLRSSFPPDCMHVIYLGVVRKLFYYYLTPNKGKRLRCRLSEQLIQILNDRINSFRSFSPNSDFQRRPRDFRELEHFKATEYRTYLLYLGPAVFKGILPNQYYNHFLLLHFAIYVYSSQLLNLLPCANACIQRFVEEMAMLYGNESMVSNVHALTHFPEFVEKLGSIESFSAFHFESFLGMIKRRIHPTLGHLQSSLESNKYLVLVLYVFTR